MSTDVDRPAAVTAQDRAMQEWIAASQDADHVIGYTLIGGKENEQTMDLLVGVPFVIEGLTFRRGDVVSTLTGELRDYVSVECLIHPLHQGKFPRERVVFNDGSTGVYRQIVRYLAAKGLVTVPENLPENGPAHATRYDVSYSGEDGNREFTIRLVCPEGLRRSDYTVEGVPGESSTFYLA